MSCPDWISFNKLSGTGDGSVSVTCAANTETSSRTGTITFTTANGTVKTVTVTQAASENGGGSEEATTPLYITFNSFNVYVDQSANEIQSELVDFNVGIDNPPSYALECSMSISGTDCNSMSIMMYEEVSPEIFDTLYIEEYLTGLFLNYYVYVKITGDIATSGILSFDHESVLEIPLQSTYDTYGDHTCKLLIYISNEALNTTLFNKIFDNVAD